MAPAWIFFCLYKLDAPAGFISFVHFLYHDVHCFLKHCGLKVFMCVIQSGVIQGDPLGATLFVIGMEPWFRMFVHRVVSPELGIVRLCADDIAVVTKSHQSLRILHQIFFINS